MLKRTRSKKSLDQPPWFGKSEYAAETVEWYAELEAMDKATDSGEGVTRSKSRSRRSSIASATKNAIVSSVTKLLPRSAAKKASTESLVPENTLRPVLLGPVENQPRPGLSHGKDNDAGLGPAPLSDESHTTVGDSDGKPTESSNQDVIESYEPEPSTKDRSSLEQLQTMEFLNASKVEKDPSMEIEEPSEPSRVTQSVAAHHRSVAKFVMENLATLYRRLQEDEIMEDPRVKDEFKEIIKLKNAPTVRFRDVDIIRSKNDRDSRNTRREIDNVVWNIRKYRVYLHDVAMKEEGIKVDTNVLSEVQRMLVELENHTRRHKGKKKALSEDPPDSKIPKSTKPESKKLERKTSDIKTETEDIVLEEESLDEIYESYGTPQEEKEEQELAEEFPIHRKRIIQATAERLGHYIEGLGEDSLLLDIIQYQLNRILQVTEGEPENEWEIYCVKKEVDNGHGGSLEEFLLDGLKRYRIFLYYYSRFTSEVDTMLIEKIIEARNIMAALGVGLVDSSGNEEGRDISDSESEDRSERDMGLFEGEHVLTDGDCSCGRFCSLALARPITPEGELPTEEREMQEWYEENQEIHKRHVTSLAAFLDLCTKDALAGKTIDPNILLCAKKVRDLDRGTMKEIEETALDDALEAVYEEVIDQSFVHQIINYYIQAMDPDSLFKLDKEVVRACKNLLEAVLAEDVEKENVEEESEKVLGPT
jgi:hypothetical protein